jgi:8-oxo-dGTP diphosphatase
MASIEKGVSSVAIYNSKGQLLVGIRELEQNFVLPGGKLEEGERPMDAAVREVREEAGVDVRNLLYLGEGLVDNPGGLFRIYAFRGTTTDVPHGREDPDAEVKKWMWVDVSHGLPPAIANNLYSPNNVTLRLLGLQEGEVDDGGPEKEDPEEEVVVALPTDVMYQRACHKLNG